MEAVPTFRAALRFWLKLGWVSFGGPTAHIALMHTELVERKEWISEARFLRALNFCMLLPGPEATQLATYCGWLMHGVRGGLAAGVMFVLPAAVLLWGLSWLYVVHGAVPWVAAVFAGLKPAVTAIVVAAVIRISQRALQTRLGWAIAAAAFVAIFFWQVPYPAIVAGAAAVGWIASRRAGTPFVSDGPAGQAGLKSSRSTLTAALVLAVAWWVPVVAAGWWQGWDGILAREGVFFSKAAMVTVGGAYAVLPYVAQQAVEHHGWLTAAQMVDGLGLAEATPGPLIIVVQFVGFLGGWNQPGAFHPLAMATLGAAIAIWTTFVPSFVWIFLGAPHIERLSANPRLNGALAAVTAAVVGVVLNLALLFGGQAFFPHGWRAGGVEWFAVAVCGAALVALQRFRASVVAVILASGALGLGWAAVS